MKKLSLLLVLLLAACSPGPAFKDNRQTVINLESVIGEGVGVILENHDNLHVVLTAGHLFEPTQLIDDNVIYMAQIDRFIESGEYNTAEVIINARTINRAALIGVDFMEDLALVVVDLKTPLPHAVMSKANTVYYGQDIYAVTAHPAMTHPFVAFGKIGGLIMEEADGIGTKHKRLYFQTQLMMGSGTSGSPVFNEENKLIGLHTVEFRSEADPNTRFSFSQPIWNIRKFLKAVDSYTTHYNTNNKPGYKPYCKGTDFQCSVIYGEGRLLEEFVKGFK